MLNKQKEKEIKEMNLFKMGLTPEEVDDILAYDDEIDRDGEDLYPLTREQELASFAVRFNANTGGHMKNRNRIKVNDEDKSALISILIDALNFADGVSDIDMLNGEREFTFNYYDKKYKVVLSCPRK